MTILMINTIIWNCRGIGNSPIITYLKKIIKKHNVALVGILEPMLAEDKVEATCKQLRMDKFWVNTMSESKIWIFWKDSIYLDSILESDQSSSFTVSNDTGMEFQFTCVYASTKKDRRRVL